MAVTRDEVVAAYRLIFGRDPENEAVVQQHMAGAGTLAALRQTMLNSDEFRLSSVRCFEPGGPMEVQVRCNPEETEAMLQRLQEDWTSKGKTEPTWSVVTDERFKSDHFASHSREFYDSGRRDVDRYRDWLARNDQEPDKFKTCLELGCGVGRVTRWLAQIHHEVLACDISNEHLELAQRYLEKEGVRNVRFIQLDSLAQLNALRDFDAIFSIVVLQHNPPPVIACVLDTLLRRLRNGGLAFFQVPTYWSGYSFTVNGYLKSDPLPPDEVEMHVLPQQHIFALAAQHDCAVLEVQPDNYPRVANLVSNTFLVKKARPRGWTRIWPLRKW